MVRPLFRAKQTIVSIFPNKTISYERRNKIKQKRKNGRAQRIFALCVLQDKKVLPIRMQRVCLQSDWYMPLTSYRSNESEGYERITKWINLRNRYYSSNSFFLKHLFTLLCTMFLYHLWNFNKRSVLYLVRNVQLKS